MKVYIVTSGSYSDYHIDEVFTDRKQAYLYCAARNTGINGEYEVEEYDTDTSKLESRKSPNRVWFGRIQHINARKFGELQKFLYRWETFDTRNEINDRGNWVELYVTTDLNTPEEKVKRIMLDRFHQWKYENDLL